MCCAAGKTDISLYINVTKPVTAVTFGAFVCFYYSHRQYMLVSAFASLIKVSESHCMFKHRRSTQITRRQAPCPLSAQNKSSKNTARQITNFGLSSYFKRIMAYYLYSQRSSEYTTLYTALMRCWHVFILISNFRNNLMPWFMWNIFILPEQ